LITLHPSSPHTLSLHDALPIYKQPLLLATRKVHKPCVALVGKAELFEQPVAVQRLWVERGPEIHSFPDLDSLLELRLLQLNPNRSEEHTSELQSRVDLVCRLLL